MSSVNDGADEYAQRRPDGKETEWQNSTNVQVALVVGHVEVFADLGEIRCDQLLVGEQEE